MSRKHKVRNFIIWIISILGIDFLYRKIKRQNGPLVRVIAYHNISDGEWFERSIKFLVENYNVLTPEQFHNKEFDPNKINILVTFDDGYKSWIKRALPVLQKYNVKAIFFTISGLLDTHGNRNKRRAFFKDRLFLVPKPVLSWDGAKALKDSGHTIGGHTVTHPRLSELSLEEVEEEVRKNKDDLESKLNVELDDFAYPFGRKADYSEEVRKKVIEAGYPYIYSAETGFFKHEDSGTLDIPRTLIEKNQPISSIKKWINGSYDIFSSLKL